MTRTFGVEEELLLVEPSTGAPVAVAAAVLDRAARGDAALGSGGGLEAELKQQQVETNTAICTGLDELAGEIDRWRRHAAEQARATGVAAAALAASPLPVDPRTTPKSRYQRMQAEFGQTAQDQLTCGCHVHVGVESDEEGVAVLDRIRVWLPVLTAMSANSPFWQGADTSYASFRSQAWNRWPSAGPTGIFGTPADYHAVVDGMLAAGLLDEGMLYFDARLSREHPTVEVRSADVCLESWTTVLLAALVRGLVETAAASWRAGEPPPPVRTEVLRIAAWRAGRYGLSGELVHPLSGRLDPAAEVVRALVGHTAGALEEAGDLDRVRELVERLLAGGNGAQLQRAAYVESGSLAGVVADAVRRTTG